MRARILALVGVLVLASGCTQAFPQAFQPEPQGPGDAYDQYLAGDAGTILVEVHHAPGALWADEAEADFVRELERITEKDVRIETNQSLPSNGEDYVYSISELVAFHEERASSEGEDGEVVMRALLLDGELGGNTAGLAFAPSTFAVAMGTIRDAPYTCENDALVCANEGDLLSGQDPSPAVEEWKLARAIAIHEAGHLVGLVNCPLPMVEDREMSDDPAPEQDGNAGRCHSENDGSVMFWQLGYGWSSFEPDDVIEGGDVPWQFDAHDVQDARAAQS